MNRAIMKHTQIAVTLAINVQVKHNGQDRLETWPLLSLNLFLLVFWQLRQAVNRVGYRLAALASDITHALDVTGKLLAIGFNALAYGLGATS